MHEGFDFRNPDYPAAFQQRLDALQRIRKNPTSLPTIKAYYREHVADFINDFGVTYDPRNVELGRPAIMPFVLFPKQREFVEWVVTRWRAGEPGLCDKSRDVGITWLAAGIAVSMCLFNRGFSVGFGSRKEDLVDKAGDPDSILWKVRAFISNLPPEFRGPWDELKHSSHLHIELPWMDSLIKGEAGDNIGRGGRCGLYFVDESSHLARPKMIDAALSATTNCRIDLSSVNGMANPFAEKRFSWPEERIFSFHWRDDPRKDQAWYDKKCSELDPITVASEIDMDYAASVEGVIIPATWVRAALDAHIALGFEPSGEKSGALDVADEGKDKNAFCGAHGVVVEFIDQWAGKGSDIMGTVQKSFELCDELEYRSFKYDADGMGAGVRGDARTINLGRSGRPIAVDAFRGSDAVFNPDGEDEPGRKNSDYFSNRKAQAWCALRKRFRNTYRAVVEGKPFDKDEIISISSKAGKHVQQLMTELSQATWAPNGSGKMVVNKAPEGTKSPNLADSVVIRFGRTSMLSTWAKLGRAA